MTADLDTTAIALVAKGKGILAADETPGTLSRRFSALGIECTPESRRIYREMLFSAPALQEHISGVILQDETIRQAGSSGVPLAQILADQGVLPGIKVDTGAEPMAGSPGETITEGLDGLRERLAEYRSLGASFAKWRAVIRIGADLPSEACILANAHALARYAALCQEQGIAPIVEPEVLMDGAHSLDDCAQVTGRVLHAVFTALFDQRVIPEGMLLKPNMVAPGRDGPAASVDKVAAATMQCLRRHVPAAVPGIAFLSGGQAVQLATAHLDAINRLPGPRPWAISFSYGRALQDPAMAAWRGQHENLALGAEALDRRARCNGAACLGTYSEEMEVAAGPGFTPEQRDDWRATSAGPDGRA
jgi:fructose-bisphosphate aldolase class I